MVILQFLSLVACTPQDRAFLLLHSLVTLALVVALLIVAVIAMPIVVVAATAIILPSSFGPPGRMLQFDLFTGFIPLEGRYLRPLHGIVFMFIVFMRFMTILVAWRGRHLDHGIR